MIAPPPTRQASAVMRRRSWVTSTAPSATMRMGRWGRSSGLVVMRYLLSVATGGLPGAITWFQALYLRRPHPVGSGASGQRVDLPARISGREHKDRGHCPPRAGPGRSIPLAGNYGGAAAGTGTGIR